MLNAVDYRAILAFLEALHGCRNLEAFPRWLLREVPKLVGSYHCTWNEVAFSVPRAKVDEYPQVEGFDTRSAAFSKHVFEHPCIVHALSIGDPGPFAISDLISEQELHRLGLYQHMYRQMGYKDQIGMFLSPPRGEVAALAIARDRRGFTDRDREILAFIRPHLALAHSNLRALERARLRLEDKWNGPVAVALLETGVGGEVRRGLSRAEPLLEHFFRHERRSAAGKLPPSLSRWLMHRPRAPHVVQRGGRNLVARFFARTPRCGHKGFILIEDHAAPAAVYRMQANGLTAREVQVLAEVEKGLSNDDIAAALFISPRTVKKHLENIFTKLGVGNRTAAAAFLRRATME